MLDYDSNQDSHHEDSSEEGNFELESKPASGKNSNFTKRRQIEDLMAERALKHDLDLYDDWSDFD